MKQIYSYLLLFLSILFGIGTGLTKLPFLMGIADAVSTLFMNFLQFLAAPIVFLSIFSTLLGMRGYDEMKTLGKKVFGYTLLTTLAASAIALSLFLLADPVRALTGGAAPEMAAPEGSYVSFLLQIVPSNFVRAFLDNNVIGIAFIAFVLGIGGLKLPKENKEALQLFFGSLFKLILKAAGFVVFLMPIGIWAFTTQLVAELGQGSSQFQGLAVYLGVVLGANLVQGLIVLPLLLRAKGISPFNTAKGAAKALVMAFFSKSSNATLPVTMECAEKRLGIQSKVAHFSLPLCTVINMNGCAAFILTTVLFVAGSHGHVFSPLELGLWVILATVAAIGNAGVPMGCFFLSSAFLIALGVPIKVMGLILPFYAFLDMVETALNVWSDLCVTAIVDKELKESSLVLVENP